MISSRAGQSSRLLGIGLCSIVMAALAVARIPAQPAEATAPPDTWSRYINNASHDSLYYVGCGQAQSSLSLGSSAEVVILTFGRAANNGSAWGTIVYSNAFASTTDIYNAMLGFLQGFYNCLSGSTSTFLTLGIGTTNDQLSNTQAASGHGAAWSQLVTSVENWIRDPAHPGVPQVEQVYGAMDFEPAWGPAAAAAAWSSAYGASYTQPYYDFGAAECQYPYDGSNRACSNYWLTSDRYQVAWGQPAAWAIPEIYTNSGSNASEWLAISKWGANYGSAGHITFRAALAQHEACVERPGDPSCVGADQGPQTAYDQLQSAINSDTQTMSAVSWDSQMSWQGT